MLDRYYSYQSNPKIDREGISDDSRGPQLVKDYNYSPNHCWVSLFSKDNPWCWISDLVWTLCWTLELVPRRIHLVYWLVEILVRAKVMYIIKEVQKQTC